MIILWRVFASSTISNGIIAHDTVLPSVKEIFQVLITLFFVIVGCIIFRAENLTQAFGYLFHMFTTIGSDWHLDIAKRMLMFGIIPLIIMEYLQRDKQHILQFPAWGIFRYRAVRWFIYLGLASAIFIFDYSGKSQEFIYFQF